MKQVFRLMDMPDRVIAFDELPQDLLEGLEMCDCSKLPRQWREFIGIREKFTRIPPDRDPLTGQVRTYPPIVQKAPYAFLIDQEVNHDKERWQEIESYVRRNAPKDFRLLDKLRDMAKPMGRDAQSELELEPEEVILIPLPKVEAAKDPEAATVQLAPEMFKCEDCPKEFDSKSGVRLHRLKKHAQEKVTA